MSDTRSNVSDSDDDSSLDETPVVRLAPPAASLEAFAARQKAMQQQQQQQQNRRLPLSPPAPAPMTQQKDAAADSPAAPVQPAKQQQLHRLNIFVLVRILFHYLDKVDPKLLVLAKQVLKDCDKRKKSGDPEYQHLADCIPPRIRACVGDAHWSKALAIQRQFLKSKQKQTRQATSSTAPMRREGSFGTEQQHQPAMPPHPVRSAFVAQKFAQAGVLATDLGGKPLAPVAAPPLHRPAMLHEHKGARRSSQRQQRPRMANDSSVTTESTASTTPSESETSNAAAMGRGGGAQKHARSHPRTGDVSTISRSTAASGSKRQNSPPSQCPPPQGASSDSSSSQSHLNQMEGMTSSTEQKDPLQRHKRVASAPFDNLPAMNGVSDASGGDSAMGQQMPLSTVASVDSSSDETSRSRDRQNEYHGQEQQQASQRRRRDGPSPSTNSSSSAAPASPSPFAFQPASHFGSGDLTKAAQQHGQQRRASPALAQFNLVRGPFSPSGFSLYHRPSTASPAPQAASIVSPAQATEPAGSRNEDAGGPVPMDFRRKAESVGSSDDSENEEEVVVDCEEDEVDDGNRLHGTEVRSYQ